MSHPAHIYRSLEEYTAIFIDTPAGRRRASREWKAHIEKHGNVPMILKCAVCSGREQKMDIKVGRYNVARPNKVLRDEAAGEVRQVPEPE